MAMTMSGNLPSSMATSGVRRRPSAAAMATGNRRRRPTAAAPSFATSAAARGAVEAEESEEKESETDALGASTRRSQGASVRFARFDEELQDSDQTITGVADWWASRSSGSRRRLEPLVTTKPRSTFFPDSTDDEAMSAHTASANRDAGKTLSVATNPGAGASPMGGLPTFPVIHIGEIQFPVTRTVLWDRRVLAGPFPLTTADVLPRFRVSNGLLKKIHAQISQETKRTTGRKQVSPQPRLLGYATGESDASGVITLTDLDLTKPSSSSSQALCCAVPVYRSKPQYPDDEEQSRQEMLHVARTTFETTSSTGSRKRAILDIQASAVACIPSNRSRAELEIELDAVVPVLELELTLIRSLPLLMTPLAVSLLRCEFGDSSKRFGFLTLDRARKAVPLLETDPLVLQRPIVGLWVYGVDLDDHAAAEGIRVVDQFLLASCVRFLVSKIVKERAQVDAGTFLLAVYSGAVAGPLPRFFECKVTGNPSTSSPISWTAAHSRSQCLAGVTSFKGDVEMDLVLGTDENSPPIPVKASSGNEEFRETPALDAWRRRSVSESATRAHASVSNKALDTGGHAAVQVETVTNAPEDSEGASSMRSCCRSQQLLALQHQEMLEKQQRQLQEMQDQIAQLQRVLTETRAENALLLAAASSRSSVSSVADSLQDHGSIVDEDLVSGPVEDQPEDQPVPSPRNDDKRENRESGPSEDVVIEGDQDDSPSKVDQDESIVSSLALSSISKTSNQSDLSSLSSSIVGTHLKTLIDAEDDAVEENGEHVEHEGEPDAQQPQAETDTPASLSSDESVKGEPQVSAIERTSSCPYQYIPPARYSTLRAPAQCERDEYEDESDASKIDELLAERLRIPNTPNREEIVRGGALATFGFSHGSSFSIPKIKYVPETVTCDSDEDEEEEIRRIEIKYRKRHVH